ncbi:MAG: hypothetical protein ACRD4R_05275 [Candidatus Acidiferrales bacterium]
MPRNYNRSSNADTSYNPARKRFGSFWSSRSWRRLGKNDVHFERFYRDLIGASADDRTPEVFYDVDASLLHGLDPLVILLREG